MTDAEHVHIAHVAIRETGEPRIQTLETHLREVSALTEKFAAKAALGRAGKLIGLLHDFGKYSREFQNYIRSRAGLLQAEDSNYIDAAAYKGKINHSFAGGQHIWRHFQGKNKYKEAVAQILALCVSSHHTGLRNCLSIDGKKDFEADMDAAEPKTHHAQCAAACDPALRREIEDLLSDDQLVLEVVRALQKIDGRLKDKAAGAGAAEQAQADNSRDFQQGLLVRFLFSCLLDADRTNSAAFDDNCADDSRKESGDANPEASAGCNATSAPSDNALPEGDCCVAPTEPVHLWDRLVARLEAHLDGLERNNPIDDLRRDIGEQCARRALDEPGIFTLTVPTGGGKTLASLRFALLHAQKHNLDRIIYVIPYTSIIDQNADVARRILEEGEEPGSIVLEHHSNFLPDRDTETDEAAKHWEKLTENWDSPVIFTSMVQFLDSLFGAGTRPARRLHNLARSVIVFDEVQTLPLHCLRMFCNAVEFLVHDCGASALLCTATQPRLDAVPDPLLGSLTLDPAREIVPDVPALFSALKRTVFFNHCRTRFSLEEIAALAEEELRQNGSCLIVCNTKRVAEKLYALCPAREGLERYYLSTNLCPAHRLEKLGGMREALAHGRGELCGRTPLIECGVDISFGSVIRLAAGLDSILQAAGRCNRHGEGRAGRVHLVRVDPSEEYLASLPDIEKGRKVFLELLHTNASRLQASGWDLTAPDLVADYFERYFRDTQGVMSYGLDDTSSNTLLDMLGSSRCAVGGSRFPGLGQSFRDAAARFQPINSRTTSIIVPYGKEGDEIKEGVEIITSLCSTELLYKKKALLRRAQRFSVNLFPNMLSALEAAGALHNIQKSGILALSENFYCPEMGVVTQALSGRGKVQIF